jgi:hypothetical protein
MGQLFLKRNQFRRQAVRTFSHQSAINPFHTLVEYLRKSQVLVVWIYYMSHATEINLSFLHPGVNTAPQNIQFTFPCKHRNRQNYSKSNILNISKSFIHSKYPYKRSSGHRSFILHSNTYPDTELGVLFSASLQVRERSICMAFSFTLSQAKLTSQPIPSSLQKFLVQNNKSSFVCMLPL